MDQRKTSGGGNSSVVASAGRIPGTCVGEEFFDCEQPASSPNAPPAKPGTETEPAGSIPSGSESADPVTDKSSELSKVRRPASTGSITGAPSDGHWNRRAGFFEAPSDKKWYQAIERKDCKMLMAFLKQDSALLQETGKAGRTVLHVAAIQGCLELVIMIRQTFSSGNFNAEFAQQLHEAEDGRCAATAGDIAVHIVGNTEVGKAIEKIHRPGFAIGRRSPPWLTGKYRLTQEQVDGVQHIIDEAVTEGTKEGRYEGLKTSFEENVDYNFCSSLYGDLFLFHHACSPFYEPRVADHGNRGEDFVGDVIERCRKVSEERVLELMKLQDFQGRTALHVAVAAAPHTGRDAVLHNLSRCLQGRSAQISKYLGVRNARGWTPFHVAATQPFSAAFFWNMTSSFESSVHLARINEDLDGSGDDKGESLGNCSALHLAVLHNNPKFVEETWSLFRMATRARLLEREITFANCDGGYGRQCRWTPMSLALLVGNVDMVQLHLGRARQDDFGPVPVLHLAAALGNPEILRQLLNDSNRDPLERDALGRTTLHYAAHGLMEPSPSDIKKLHDALVHPIRANTYVCFRDVPNVEWLDERHAFSPQDGPNDTVKGYSGRKGCINMLLQEGVDMWQKDYKGRIASPGRRINDDEFISWWHEKIAKETLDTKNNLNQGGNAISVIGALIATASYVGPLQPPLSYGVDPSLQLSPTSDNTGYARVWDLPVRVFMVSNSLSFYLAIASIMLAVVPSLPMPQESLLKELERTRKTVASAICVLLLSVVGNLVSYAAASVAVMPEHNSWRNVGLTAYPALVGGLACLIGIVLFIIRVLRLIYPGKCRRVNVKIRKCWNGKQIF